MKGAKLKKKDRAIPVHVIEIKQSRERPLPPRMLITAVHPPLGSSQAVLRLSGPLPVPQ